MLFMLLAPTICPIGVGGLSFTLRKVDGTSVPSTHWERPDQLLIFDHVKAEDRVLMLGGNIGSACIALDRVVSHGKHVACVEPNEKLIATLRENREQTNSSFHVVNALLTRNPGPIYMRVCNGVGDGTCSVATSSGLRSNAFALAERAMGALGLIRGSWVGVPTKDLWALESEMFHKQKFTFAVVDCEGCFCSFAEEYPTFLEQLRGLIVEVDGIRCDYDALLKKMHSKGLDLHRKFNLPGGNEGGHKVMLRGHPSTHSERSINSTNKTYGVFLRR